MATTVFPESGDQITEAAWTALNEAMTVAERYRVNGYTVSAGTGLNANVAAGTCVVNGYYINSDATQAVSVTASQTNYIWLNEDGTLSSNTTGTNPGDELLLGLAVTDGSGVTSVSHEYDIANGMNVVIIKPSDESVNNSTTLQDDDDFQFTVDSGSQWEIDVFMAVTQPDASADFKCGWNISGGSLSQYNRIYANTSSAGGLSFDAQSTTVSVNTFAFGFGLMHHLKSIVFVTTGGTLALQWAQNTAFAGNTTVNADSFLIARRILG